MDTKRRSELMAGIRGRDTALELAVGRIAHRMDLRFRVHRKNLPGHLDLVFWKHRLAVFVHLRFWHRHEGCPFSSNPISRVAFWMVKIAANVDRDARQQVVLKELGWSVLVIWECETKNDPADERRLVASIKPSWVGDPQECSPEVPLPPRADGPDSETRVVSVVALYSGDQT